MSKSVLKRVVGKRVVRDESDVAGVSIEDFDFDEEGRFCVVETSFIDPNDDAETAQLRRTRMTAFQEAYSKLAPPEFVAYLALANVIGDAEKAIDERILCERSHHLLVDVILPSHHWRQMFDSAFGVILKGTATRHVFASTVHHNAFPETERFRDKHFIDAAKTLDRLRDGHVLVTRLAADHLPPALAVHVDIAVDLSSPLLEHVAAAVDRAFGTQGASWPAGLPVHAIRPGWFGAACDRAIDPQSVAPIVNSLLQADLAMQKERAECEAADAKPASTKSTNRYVPEILRPQSPLLTDLHGYGDARAWGESLAADLALYRIGKLGWQDVDAGCLLHGPPGTGKTLFASALAASCGVPFIATSYAQWQASGDGHLGYVVKAIRATFAAANENAPCILFIDEIDTVRARGGRDYDGWWTAINTCLLECADGTSRREGVVVIAACNYPDNLDPALVRSGRLDRRFEIALPDETALLGIMRHHLPDADAKDLAPAATVLAGSASGADIVRIARDARRVARRQDRCVTAADLLAIAMPADKLSERDRRLVAVHEAGHAVAVMCAGRIPDAMSIVSKNEDHGVVRADAKFGMGRLGEFETEIVIRLAGRAAEEIILGEPSAGAESDLQVATALVSQIIGKTGLSGRLTYDERVEGNAVEARLRDLYARALRMIGEHRAVVEALTDLAIEKRVLGRAALVAFAAAHGFGGRR